MCSSRREELALRLDLTEARVQVSAGGDEGREGVEDSALSLLFSRVRMEEPSCARRVVLK